MKDETLLRRSEVARRLGVRVSTLSEWANVGRGPKCIRLTPRCIRYRASDVDKFLRQNTVGTG